MLNYRIYKNDILIAKMQYIEDVYLIKRYYDNFCDTYITVLDNNNKDVTKEIKP